MLPRAAAVVQTRAASGPREVDVRKAVLDAAGTIKGPDNPIMFDRHDLAEMELVELE
jgi:hypothetical protein